jgi:hypothetical protein
MMGRWEDVRRMLGVEGLGLKMPDNPHDSVAGLRSQVGIGIFSDKPLFLLSEIDRDAIQAYYDQAHATFSKSSEAQQVVERHGELGWVQMLLEFGLDYLGQCVDEMTLGSVKEFVLDHVPRKVSVEADEAPAIIYELIKFWEYLDRVYKLPEAKSIIEWLHTDGLSAQLKAEMSDPLNFGMAKSIFMRGKEAGYDMSSQNGMADFMAAYNQSLPSNKAPLARGHRVGRNDPCPCGSGKKHKKCCGRSGGSGGR